MRDKKYSKKELINRLEELAKEIDGIPELIIFHTNCNNLPKARQYAIRLSNYSKEIRDILLKTK